MAILLGLLPVFMYTFELIFYCFPILNNMDVFRSLIFARKTNYQRTRIGFSLFFFMVFVVLKGLLQSVVFMLADKAIF